MILQTIIDARFQITAVVLFGIGFITLLIHTNLIKKIIGMNIMDTAVVLLLAAVGYIDDRTAPILLGSNPDYAINADLYINPVPGGLVLTGIVVAVSTTAFFLALAQRMYKIYGTLEMDEIILLAKKKEE